MNIYEIDRQILDCIDEETGEVLNIESLEKLMQDKQNKIENVALWYKNLTAESTAIKAEVDNLNSRRKHNETLAESLKKYLGDALGGEKFKTPKVAISYRKSSSVEVDDVYKLPDEFLTYKMPEPKKTDIKNAILGGREFEGVRIIEKNNIQIK